MSPLRGLVSGRSLPSMWSAQAQFRSGSGRDRRTASQEGRRWRTRQCQMMELFAALARVARGGSPANLSTTRGMRRIKVFRRPMEPMPSPRAVRSTSTQPRPSSGSKLREPASALRIRSQQRSSRTEPFRRHRPDWRGVLLARNAASTVRSSRAPRRPIFLARIYSTPDPSTRMPEGLPTC